MQSLNRVAGFQSNCASTFVLLVAFVAAFICGGFPVLAQPAAPARPAVAPAKPSVPRTDELKIDPDKLPDWYHAPPEPLAIKDLDLPLATKEELAKLKREFGSAYRQTLKTCDVSANGRKIIEGAIHYKLAEMTVRDRLSDLPSLRKTFVQEFTTIGDGARRKSEIDAMTALVGQEVVKQIPELLKNNSYVRLNAVYILCEMNYAPAYDLLLQVMRAPDIRKDEENGQPETLKIVAAMGLVRILRFSSPSVKERTAMASGIIESLKDSQTHFWYQLRLIEALRYCEIAGFDPGDKDRPFVVECLMSIVNDANRTWKVRTRACYALGRVPLPKSVKVEDVVTAITECALQISNAAAADPNHMDWKYCFYNLYAAFHTVDGKDKEKDKDLDTEKKGAGGLLVRFKVAAQPAYAVIVPIVADILTGKAPDAGNLQKLTQFARSRQTDAAQAGTNK